MTIKKFDYTDIKEDIFYKILYRLKNYTKRYYKLCVRPMLQM